MPVEPEVNIEETEEGWPLCEKRIKHGTFSYRGLISLDILLRLIYYRTDDTYKIMRACGREILALSIDLLRDLVTGCVRCGDKNKFRRVRYLKGSGIAIFVGTAPTLDSKYEKQSKEHKLVQKSRPDYNVNEERTMKLTKTNKYERRLKLKGLRIIKFFHKNYFSDNRNCTKNQLLWKDFDV